MAFLSGIFLIIHQGFLDASCIVKFTGHRRNGKTEHTTTHCHKEQHARNRFRTHSGEISQQVFSRSIHSLDRFYGDNVLFSTVNQFFHNLALVIWRHWRSLANPVVSGHGQNAVCREWMHFLRQSSSSRIVSQRQ